MRNFKSKGARACFDSVMTIFSKSSFFLPIGIKMQTTRSIWTNTLTFNTIITGHVRSDEADISDNLKDSESPPPPPLTKSGLKVLFRPDSQLFSRADIQTYKLRKGLDNICKWGCCQHSQH
jgi:hypothetical protein